MDRIGLLKSLSIMTWILPKISGVLFYQNDQTYLRNQSFRPNFLITTELIYVFLIPCIVHRLKPKHWEMIASDFAVWIPSGSVGWGCRIHRLYLSKKVRLLQKVCWILHKTIRWWVFSNTWALWDAEYSFIAIAPRSSLIQCCSTW